MPQVSTQQRTRPQPVAQERPASDGQQALWRFYKLAPDSPAYNMAYAAELRPDVDLVRLQAAFRHVVLGHEALSSGYAEEDGAVVMRRPAEVVPDVTIRKVEKLSDEDILAWLQTQADQPFVLEQPQPCRLRILVVGRGAARRVCLCVGLHHIAGDFVSFELFAEAVFDAYGRLREGRPPEAVVPGRYWDWLDRQSHLLDGPRGEALADFWRAYAAETPPPPALPADGVDSTSGRHAGEEVTFELGDRDSARLRRLAQDWGISLFALLATAFQILLHRASGQDRLLIGTPVSGRSGAAFKDLIGYTLNAVPWRVDLGGNPRVADAARAAQRELRAGLRHGRYPLSRIAALASAAGVPAPLFRHMVTLVPHGRRACVERNVVREFFATQRGAANEINLRWQDTGRRLIAQWRYDTDRFGRDTVDRMIAGLRALLDQMVKTPQARVSDLTAVAPEHRAVLAGPATRGGDHTALQAFERCARHHAERLAVVDGEIALSYGALDARATELAGRLWRAGARPGDRIGVMLPRGAALAVAMLAAWKVGAAYVCLDPAGPPERLAYMLADSGAALVLGVGTAPAWLADVRWMPVDAGAPEGDAVALPAPCPAGDLPAYVIYTSGSTGTPKGVEVSHGNLLHYVRGVLKRLKLAPRATLCSLASVATDLGYTAWFGALLSGRSLCVVGDALAADPDALARYFAGRPVDCLKIVPSHLKALMAVDDPARLLPRACLVLGGEALDGAFVRRLAELRPDCRIVNHYGPTEATVGCLTHRVGEAEAAAGRDVPIGLPLDNVRAAVLDRYLDPVAIGGVGELAIGGAGVAAGYVGRPGLTAQRFVPDPCATDGSRLYRTGDCARLLPDGGVRFLGRTDGQVKIRGFRVELAEVEAWLKHQPGIADAVAVARPGPHGDGQRLLAYGVAGEGAFDPAGLRAAMADSLPDAMVPARIVMLAELPRLPNGKVDRQALPEPAEPTGQEPDAGGRPRDAVEERLVRLWAEVLDCPAPSIHDDFFDLGGDSILALQIVAQTRADGLDLVPKDIFEHRTIAALAAALATRPGQTRADPETGPEVAPFSLSGLDGDGVRRLRDQVQDLADAYVLSPLQQGLLFHSLLDADSGAYVNQLVVEATGPFVPERFAAAWQSAVDAHPILRTSFRWEALEQALQCVHRTASLPVATFDWRDLDGDRQTRALRAYCVDDRARGFRLDQAPLMRLALARVGAERWWLIWSRHHLIVDGWCSVLLLDEVLERYRATLAGRPPAVVDRPSYRHHIAWLARQDAAAARTFWRRTLHGVEGLAPLPVLRPAGAGAIEPIRHRLSFDAATTQRLRAAARRRRVTLNTMLQAAWGLVLAGLTGRADVVVGVTSAGRPPDLAGAEHILGVFINTLPLRLRPAASLTPDDYLGGVQDDNVAMRDFEHASLADVQAAAGCDGALFDTIMVFQNQSMIGRRERHVDAVHLRQMDNIEQTHYGLTLEVLPEDELVVEFTADRRRIDPDDLARIAGYQRAAVLGLADPACARIGDVDLRDRRERDTVAAWGRHDAPYDLSPDWVARVAAQVARTPHRIVARCGDAALSYRQLWDDAGAMARGLAAAGVAPDGLVALLFPRGLELLTMMVAVLRAGAAWLPLDPRHPPARWRQTLAQAGSPLLVCAAELRQALPPALAGRAMTGTDLRERGAPDGWAEPTARGDQLAYVIPTSGSTGTPKAAMVTRDGMLNNMLAKTEPLGLNAGDVIAQTASSCFDISVWQTLTAPLFGACVEIVPDDVVANPEALLQVLRSRSITLFEPVPSLMQALLDIQRGVPAPLPSLRWVLPTGEALPPACVEAWFKAYPDIPLMNAYGPAECADDVAFHPLRAATPPGRAVPIGAPTANAQLDVLDANHMPVPLGVVGQIAVGGVGVGRGYLADPRRTAAAFVPDPSGRPGARRYLTGDLGRWRPDGALDFVGRTDFQVKLRGFRIEPGEIEAQLERHPGVKRALVAVRRLGGGDHLVAYWQPEADTDPSDQAVLREHLAGRLPAYMVPAAWVRVADWPLTANGKIDQRALPQPAAPASGAAPRTETERRLAVLWRALLPEAEVGRDSDFFACGGHSLLATRLVARLRLDGFGGLTLRAVFDAPVLRALAARLDRMDAAPDDAPPLRPVERGATMVLSLAQQRLWLVDRLAGTGSPAYNMATTVALTGALDVDALQAALDTVIARHEILRTRYPETDGEPVAVIAPEAPARLSVIDLSALDDAARRQRLRDAERDNTHTPFAIDAGPLVRATLVRLDATSHRLLFAMHHMIGDGWSVGILIDEFAAAYRAARDGHAPDLPPLPVQYADYAVWQRALLSADRLASETGYWRTRLDGVPPLLALPTDRPHPPTASHRGDVVGFEVSEALTRRIERFARAQDSTVFIVLLAAFLLLLHRLAKAPDVVVGTDTAGRPHRDLEGLIGFFVNVLPIRSTLEPDMDFQALVERTRQTALAAFEHDMLPFDRIVEAVGAPRDRRVNPLVQALFVMQNVPAGRFDVPGLAMDIQPPRDRYSKFDMALFVEPRGRAMAAEWVYATDLFDRATVRGFADAWLALLDQVMRAPRTALSTLSAPPGDQEARQMDHSRRMSAKLDRLKQVARADGAAGLPAKVPPAPVRTRFLAEGRTFPIVVEPGAPDLDPVAWAAANRDFIDTTVCRHAAILFRGFDLATPARFEAFAEAIEPGLFGGYGDLPKKEGGRNIYRSTPYPEPQMILYHNESSHLERWPRKQWFYCEQPARVGGATPIVDCREMLRRLPAEVVELFERKQLLYIRTFTRRLDVDWRDFFRTDDRAAVEARCRAAGSDCRWLDGDTLQTRTRCPAVIRHPLTGERSFFNQVQLHHIGCLDAEVRADLLDMVGIDRMPRHVLFGDGTPIGDDIVEVIGQAYEACAVRFAWRRGDVVMLDNMLAAHARDPYQGERRIVVAMGDMTDRDAVTGQVPPDPAAAGAVR